MFSSLNNSMIHPTNPSLAVPERCCVCIEIFPFFPHLLAEVTETKKEDLIFYKPHCGIGERILFPGRAAAGFGSSHCFQWID